MTPPFAATPDGVAIEISQALAEARGCAVMADALTLAERAYQAAKQRAPRDRAVAGHVTCFYLYRTGAAERAIALGQALLPLLKSEGLEAAYAEIVRWVGVCAVDIDRFDLGIKFATEGWQIAQHLDDPVRRVFAVAQLGAAFGRSGDPWQGERLLRDAVPAARVVSDPYALVMLLNNLIVVLTGKFYWMRGSHVANLAHEADEGGRALAEGVLLAREVITLSVALDDAFFNTFAIGNLGELLVHSGDIDEARELLATALRVAQTNGFKALISRILCSQAELAVVQGDRTAALALLTNADTEPPTVAMRLRLHYALYRAYQRGGDSVNALAQLEVFRRIECRRAIEQLRARSQLMVTRIETEDAQRELLRQAYETAHALSTRATELEQLMLEDELTRLGNRRALDLRLPPMLINAQLALEPVSVLVIDLDHFKRINDVFGHTVGDRVLVQVARLLREHLRDDDLVARTGGEEFVVVLPNTDRDQAFALCDRIRRRVHDCHWRAFAPDAAVELQVTLSAGVACTPAYDGGTLFERADLAMYKAKRAGRNRVAMAP